MSATDARQQAMALLATYDRQDADAYERHLTRLTRSWLAVIRSTKPMQGVVDRLIDELLQPPPDDYGVGWDDLKRKFFAWAVAEEWIAPHDRRLAAAVDQAHTEVTRHRDGLRP